ncbi:MAG: peptidylprolyl isomerase [Acidobacteriota bacterium]
MKECIVVLMLLPCLCNAQGRIVEEIVAVVNNDAITRSEYQEAEAGLRKALATRYSGDELDTKFNEAKTKLLDSMIEDRLLLQEARDKEFNVESEINEILENLKKENNLKTDEELERALASEGFTLESWKVRAREQLLKHKLIGSEVESKIRVTEAELVDYYTSHPDEFQVEAKVNLKEIFVMAEGRGQQAASSIAGETLARVTTGGEDFSVVAQAVSESPSKAQGGDLGWIAEKDLAPDLSDAVKGLSPGQIAPVLTTEKGSRIVKLEGRQEASLRQFDDVRESIELRLRDEKREGEIDKYIEQLKKDSYIFKPGETKGK